MYRPMVYMFCQLLSNFLPKRLLVMPPLGLPVHIQFNDMTDKLQSIQEDLNELEALLAGLNIEKEEYKRWILENAYKLGLTNPDSFIYQQLQRRTNQWNIQLFATEETIEDLERRKNILLQQQEEIKKDLSQLLK